MIPALSIRANAPRQTVLVIDDAKFSREVVAKVLESNGEEVLVAKDGQEGLAMTFKHKPDLVIADLLMPHMNGYDYCRQVRMEQSMQDLPIIIHTGIIDPHKRAEAFACGASDLLLKPLNAEELMARANVHMERNHLLQELREQQETIQEEMAQAQAMQQDILPGKQDVTRLCNALKVSIAARFKGSEDLSGDFWGIHQLSDHEVAISLVDCAGHGVMAALNTFRIHTMINTDVKPTKDPAEFLNHLNKNLHGLLPVNHFATMFYGVIDLQEKMIRYAAAGSPNPFIFREGEYRIKLDGTGLPLSIMENTVYETKEATFQEDDVLICYSDVFVESKKPEDKHFAGEEGFLSWCSNAMQAHHKHLDMAATDILNHFYQTIEDGPLKDDLTLVMIGYR